MNHHRVKVFFQVGDPFGGHLAARSSAIGLGSEKRERDLEVELALHPQRVPGHPRD